MAVIALGLQWTFQKDFSTSRSHRGVLDFEHSFTCRSTGSCRAAICHDRDNATERGKVVSWGRYEIPRALVVARRAPIAAAHRKCPSALQSYLDAVAVDGFSGGEQRHAASRMNDPRARRSRIGDALIFRDECAEHRRLAVFGDALEAFTIVGALRLLGPRSAVAARAKAVV